MFELTEEMPKTMRTRFRRTSHICQIIKVIFAFYKRYGHLDLFDGACKEKSPSAAFYLSEYVMLRDAASTTYT